MAEIWAGAASALGQMPAWEMLAVLLALAYLLLAMRESIWCWPAALLSTAIFTLLLWHVSLVMHSALNVYYMGMAVYGWWLWRHRRESQLSVRVHRWKASWHLLALGGILSATLVSGYLLSQNSSAAWPYMDSFTTWGSVFTTFLVARKVLENWLYWIVIDAVSIVLYLDRGLYLTAILYALYILICIVGFIKWKANMQSMQVQASA